MKETLEILGFILCVTMVFILAMFVSMKLQAETPIPDPHNPTPPENNPCWYVEFPCDDDKIR